LLEYLKQREQQERFEVLDLEENSLKDLSFLKEISNLKYLNISRNQIRDISILKDAVNLEFLDLSFNPFCSLEGIEHLKKLKYLKLENCFWADLKPIANLMCLKYLILDSTEIFECGGNLSLAKKEKLEFDFYEENLEVILGLKNLETVWLSENFNRHAGITNDVIFNKLPDCSWVECSSYEYRNPDLLWEEDVWEDDEKGLLQKYGDILAGGILSSLDESKKIFWDISIGRGPSPNWMSKEQDSFNEKSHWKRFVYDRAKLLEIEKNYTLKI
jgi:hypothetical protein